MKSNENEPFKCEEICIFDQVKKPKGATERRSIFINLIRFIRDKSS